MELVEPVTHRAETTRVNAVDAASSFRLIRHQLGRLQDAQVLRNCWSGYGKALSEFHHRLGARLQTLEDGAASRIPKGGKNGGGGGGVWHGMKCV